MRFLKVGSDEEVKIPNLGADDHRSILTPDRYLVFRPNDRATSAFLVDLPEAQQKRQVERYRAQEARMREGGTPDPRGFFKFDPVNSFWSVLEVCARALRGELGGQQKAVFEQRFQLASAEGPGGRWYREQMGFDSPGGSMLWITTLWSPEAGYNPASRISAIGRPDGKPESRTEWRWKSIDGIYVPSTIQESTDPAGGMAREQRSVLQVCSLNRPLDPHQFDEKGLGAVDGDLILDHRERVGYLIRGGEPVKLANFGEGSVLRRPTPRQAPATDRPKASPPAGAGAAAAASPRSSGRIYTTASLETDARGMPVHSVVAVDPETGEVTKVVDGLLGRFRLSPDARNLAYVSGDYRPHVHPPERFRQSLWIQPTAGGEGPRRVVYLDGANGGELPVWSADGKQIIVSVSSRDEARKTWVFETFRINADGSGREPLKIPAEDSVQDWSPDGAWVVTTSSRNAKIGWQLYLMHPDGSNQRQLTEGGNPYYTRLSPDGRRLLYSDGPPPDRRGIWVVDVDGKNRRRVFPTGKDTASACWSPDGRRMAVAIRGSSPQEHGRLEIVELDGTHRTILTMPGQEIPDMPDWR